MTEFEFVSKLFTTLPRLQTLSFFLNPDGMGVVTHLNGIDMRILTKKHTEFYDEEKIALVEMDFPLEQWSRLCQMINHEGQMFLTGYFKRRYFFRGCDKALTLKELIGMSQVPFDGVDFYKKLAETFSDNPELGFVNLNPSEGVVRVRGKNGESQRVIYEGKLINKMPSYIENEEPLKLILDSLPKGFEEWSFSSIDFL